MIVAAADEVVGSIDTEELAKYLSLNSDPEDEEAQKFKKKMEETRDQLADALYQKGLALAETESLKIVLIICFGADQVLSDLIQDESEKSKKKFYDLKIQLVEEMGWTHISTYEKQWMHVRFPPTLPPF
ncbi:hypothetical protein PR202_ga02233 [Eleusine coracana subsp. coracana]|uniref:Uncharacterized protein n=1 Tax=Eleusine coracana subsp. coracana TaxID=191504 RepID=A0AAV5BM88_ELECO|nr:hypothetical protein PR202_ga02233 [Eleusine coracana subsp. coracana]